MREEIGLAGRRKGIARAQKSGCPEYGYAIKFNPGLFLIESTLESGIESKLESEIECKLDSGIESRLDSSIETMFAIERCNAIVQRKMDPPGTRKTDQDEPRNKAAARLAILAAGVQLSVVSPKCLPYKYHLWHLPAHVTGIG